MLELVHGLAAQRQVVEDRHVPDHHGHVEERPRAQGMRDGVRCEPQRPCSRAADDRLCNRAPEAERQRLPETGPRRREDDQRRSDGEQEHVLRHVRRKERVGERVERRVECDDDCEQSESERGGPAGLLEPVAGGDSAAPAKPVENGRDEHDVERGLDRPGCGARQARHRYAR